MALRLRQADKFVFHLQKRVGYFAGGGHKPGLDALQHSEALGGRRWRDGILRVVIIFFRFLHLLIQNSIMSTSRFSITIASLSSISAKFASSWRRRPSSSALAPIWVSSTGPASSPICTQALRITSPLTSVVQAALTMHSAMYKETPFTSVAKRTRFRQAL